VRIAIDIDSTLHHYWDLFAEVAHRRFGVKLPYEDQRTWAVTRLKPGQVRAIVAETHAERHVLEAEPYPGAVEAIQAWRADGHWIHITSHRSVDAHDATAQWLTRIGLEVDDLHCSWDKISRCRELGVGLLIDDSPVNLARAVEAGMLAATIEHPWNREVVEEEDVIAARDWPELARRLAPLLRAGEARRSA
jgi:beta-phosphoglucomutase-like phosphatase (HAD superfamily)